MRSLGALVLGAALALSASPVVAQTAQAFSVQASVLSARLTAIDNDELGFGTGGEIQVRWNPSQFSVGVGFQSTEHTLDPFTFTFRGFFVEPRYVILLGSDRVAPYVSARLMALTVTLEVPGFEEEESSGSAFAGGGGLLVRLGSRVNLDAGVTAGKEYYDGEAADGATVVARLGLAVGLF